jgi:hypothetical protein
LPRKSKQDGTHAAVAPARTDLGLPADPRLIEVFGSTVPPEELKTWAGMTEARREKALRRVPVLDAYTKKGSTLNAETAAKELGIKLRRFYQIAELWGNRRSLSHLGAEASATKTRQRLPAEVTNALQAVVADVVKDNDGASLRTLARKLVEAADLPSKPPALNTLLTFIERERRRVSQATLAGTEILFDLSASSMMKPDGRAYTLFLVIDRGTSLILGHAAGDVDGSVEGYREAAADSLRRIPTLLPGRRIWADGMERSQIVPGVDAEAVASLVMRVRSVQNVAFQSTGPKSAGGYTRRHVGLKLGTVRLIPSQSHATGGSDTDPQRGAGLSQEEALARVELAVAEHNAQRMKDLKLTGAEHPPEKLIAFLEMMAS